MALSSLNPILQANLKKLGIQALNTYQKQALPGLLSDQNVLMAGESGCGKSLAWMIALAQKISQENNRSQILELFQEQNLQWAFNKEHEKFENLGKHGALIVIPNRELIFQTYTTLRMLFPELAIFRTTGMHDLAGVIQFFKAESANASQLRKLGLINMARNLDWNAWDIAITGARGIEVIVNYLKHVKQFNFDPRTVVFDECDLLLTDRYYVDPIFNVLKNIGTKGRQFVCSMSSSNDDIRSMTSIIRPTHIYQSENYERVSSNLKIDFIQLGEDNHNSMTDIEHLKHLLNVSRSKKFLIYANTKHKLEDIKNMLGDCGISYATINTHMLAERRADDFYKFLRGEARVLVASEIVTRGLNLDVEHVVLFDSVSNNSSLLQRVGRVGRGEKQGKITCFIRPGDEWIMEKLRPGAFLKSVSPPGRVIRKNLGEYTTSSGEEDNMITSSANSSDSD
ncbi:unnamed protein product [Blepharisma stoltei]|uniref:Uncharacterized protein n=1 Tax=Blepharisma stoltei TaxID=1481888 RepID=A0AAU9J0C7_9CILI|nr:unnamed protein product [Blepharisma stoltei]